jgi:signal transduction histidine kinase
MGDRTATRSIGGCRRLRVDPAVEEVNRLRPDKLVHRIPLSGHCGCSAGSVWDHRVRGVPHCVWSGARHRGVVIVDPVDEGRIGPAHVTGTGWRGRLSDLNLHALIASAPTPAASRTAAVLLAARSDAVLFVDAAPRGGAVFWSGRSRGADTPVDVRREVDAWVVAAAYVRAVRVVWPWLLDGALAAVATQVAVVLTAEVAPSGSPRLVLLGLAVVHAAPLVLRRRFPVPVLATSVAAGAAYGVFLPAFRLGPALLVALYTVAARCERRTSLAGLTTAGVGLAISAASTSWLTDLGSWATYAGLLVGAWLLGDNVGRRQLAVAAAEARAAEAAMAQRELARQAVAQERLRIARELHDVVAHSMSVIALQSGTGRLVIDRRPEEARAALAAIERTSRATLAEMRQLLSVLRQDGDPRDPLDPAPGLRDLDGLVAQVASSGVAVDVRVEGPRRDLPAGLDLSAYRIVQEALTNVLKHARASKASVVIRYGQDALDVEVVDDGTGGASAEGHGTIGMRERATLYGGTFEAGPRPQGGYRVAARLPYEAAP